MPIDPLPPKLAFACPQRWQEMRVDGLQQRFCEQCQLHVRDLSAITEGQGRRVLSGETDRLCVSFLVRPDGTMVTRSRWEGVKRGWLTARQGALTLLALVMPFAFVSCSSNDRNQANRTGGKVCVAPPDDKSPPSMVLGRLPVVRTAGTPLPPKQKTGGR